MVKDVSNFSSDRAREFLATLAKPRFKRRRVMEMVPGLTVGQINGWVARGFLEKQACIGTADDMARAAVWIEENKGKRLYTAFDVMQILILDTLSRGGFPQAWTPGLLDMTLSAMQQKILGSERDFHAQIGPDGKPAPVREDVELKNAEWIVVLDIGKIVDRFVEAISERP